MATSGAVTDVVRVLSSVLGTYGPHLFLAYLVLRLFQNRFKPHLRKIPGPPAAGWSRLWRAWDASTGNCAYTFIDIHRRYGKVVRIGPAVVSLSDPKWIPTLFNSKETFKKTNFYPIQDIIYNKKAEPNLFSSIDANAHRNDKRRVGSAFSLPILLENEPAFDENLNLFMEKMSGFAKRGQDFDLGLWLQYFAFDVVGQVSIGKRFGFMDRGEDVDNIIHGITGGLTYFSVIGQIPELHKLLLGNPLLRAVMPSMEKTNPILSFTMKAIHERATVLPNGDITCSDNKAKDMLARWAKVSSEDPEKMKTRDIVVHLSTNVLAGKSICYEPTLGFLFRCEIPLLLDVPRHMARC